MTPEVPIALAMGAGMLATVNPCGFALLPAYVGFFVGNEDGDADGDADGGRAIGRALVVTAAVALGFVAVFGTVGLAVTVVAQSLDDHLSWLTIVVGLGFVIFGLVLLTGRQVTFALPKLARGGRTRSPLSMFAFGVSYAVASLSCTLPVFLTTLVPTFRNAGVASGLAAFLFYALGMGLVLGVVTVAVALARMTVVTRLRQILPHVSRLSGALLVAAGAYVSYYGLWELQGDFDPDPVIDTAIDIQTWLANRVDVLPRGLMLIALAAATVVAISSTRRQRRKPKTPEEVSQP